MALSTEYLERCIVTLESVLLGALSEAFHDSTIPFFVEARDWARLPDSFHAEIERDYVVLVAAGAAP